jgi:hypothetical protein
MNNDLISRSALLEHYGLKNATKYGNETAEQQHNSYSTMMLYEIADMIDDAPAVDAEPVRHGRWEPVFRRNVFGEHYVEWHACSICKELALSRCENYMDDEELSNYCPNCGCKMDAEVEG